MLCVVGLRKRFWILEVSQSLFPCRLHLLTNGCYSFNTALLTSISRHENCLNNLLAIPGNEISKDSKDERILRRHNNPKRLKVLQTVSKDGTICTERNLWQQQTIYIRKILSHISLKGNIVVKYFPALLLPQRLGCDNMLESHQQEDPCLQCGGNGQSCYRVKNSFSVRNLPTGMPHIFMTDVFNYHICHITFSIRHWGTRKRNVRGVSFFSLQSL